MKTSTLKIDDFDNKVRCVIGNLHSMADPVSIPVLTAYDPSKDRHANVKVLGGSKFRTPMLDTCANFLGIAAEDGNGSRLFSNKPALAMRIVLEIESLFPTMCGDCSEEYAVEFKSQEIPSHRCYLCFQGSHNCKQFSDKASIMPPNHDLPSGMIWLCNSCKMVNNPIKTKEGKNPSKVCSKASTPANKTPTHSGLQTPVSPTNSQIESDLFSDDEHPTICPQALSEKLNIVLKNQKEDICGKFKIGKCPYGISGQTVYNGTTCSYSHPKRCNKFMRFGNKRKGCTLGAKCEFYHPIHCKSSLNQRKCFDDKCCLVHLCGTKRTKTSETSKEKPKSSGTRSREQSNNKVNPQHQRKKGEAKESIPANPSENSFLEIKSLLEALKDNFQKEITSLRSQITFQDSRINALNPSSFRMGYHHLHPTQQQIQTPSPMMPIHQWSQFLPSSS